MYRPEPSAPQKAERCGKVTRGGEHESADHGRFPFVSRLVHASANRPQARGVQSETDHLTLSDRTIGRADEAAIALAEIEMQQVAIALKLAACHARLERPVDRTWQIAVRGDQQPGRPVRLVFARRGDAHHPPVTAEFAGADLPSISAPILRNCATSGVAGSEKQRLRASRSGQSRHPASRPQRLAMGEGFRLIMGDVDRRQVQTRASNVPISKRKALRATTRSRFDKGSSNRTRGGSRRSRVRAPTRCCCPPESVPPESALHIGEPDPVRARSCARLLRSALGRPRKCAGGKPHWRAWFRCGQRA